MIDKLLTALFSLQESKFRTDDDVIDRLTRRVTVTVLVMFSVLVTTWTYFGKPIECWCPAQFTNTHEDYTNNICWISNTYYVPWQDDIPKPEDYENTQTVSYYQWIPFILLCQCVLCFLPSVLWRFLCRRSGLNVASLIESALCGQKAVLIRAGEKSPVSHIAHALSKYLAARQFHSRGDRCDVFADKFAKVCCLMYGKFNGNYLMVSYLLVKLLYMLNSVGQLYAMDVFLGTGYRMYGLEVLDRFLKQSDWARSERFPRVTLCNFQIRYQRQLHRYVVQCVLPINLFNEKLFVFIWFWFALLGALTTISFFFWSWQSITTRRHYKMLRSHIAQMGMRKPDRMSLRCFAEDFLRRDGLFIIKLLEHNCGSLTAAEVTAELWEEFKVEPEERVNLNSKSCNHRIRIAYPQSEEV